MTNNVYMIITAADIAARRGDIRALRQCKEAAYRLANQATGSHYLRALETLRYVKGLILDLGY